MITLGLVGGVASGKSLIALDFKKLGACIIDGDRVGHEVLGLDHVSQALIERWGDDVVGENGQLDRSAIAGIVFGSDERAAKELAFLEATTHPEIEGRIAERITQMRNLGRFPVAVLDAAVMLKTGWDSMCDQIVFVDAPRELRVKRAILRGMDEEQFLFREASQMSVEEKKKRSDYVIDNSGPPQKTFNQVQEVWYSLRQIA